MSHPMSHSDSCQLLGRHHAQAVCARIGASLKTTLGAEAALPANLQRLMQAFANAD